MKLYFYIISLFTFIYFNNTAKFYHTKKKNKNKQKQKNIRGNKKKFTQNSPLIIEKITNKNIDTMNTNKEEKNENNIFYKYLSNISLGENILENNFNDIKNNENNNQNENNDIVELSINNEKYKFEIIEPDKFLLLKHDIEDIFNNHASELITLLIIKMFFNFNNINYSDIILNNKAEINLIHIKKKIKQSDLYNAFEYLTNHISIFKKIIFLILNNLLNINNNKNNNDIVSKVVKFFQKKNNSIVSIKNKLLENFKQLEKININFKSEDMEEILYILTYELEKNTNSYLDKIFDNDFLRYISYTSNEKYIIKNNNNNTKSEIGIVENKELGLYYIKTLIKISNEIN